MKSMLKYQNPKRMKSKRNFRLASTAILGLALILAVVKQQCNAEAKEFEAQKPTPKASLTTEAASKPAKNIAVPIIKSNNQTLTTAAPATKTTTNKPKKVESTESSRDLIKNKSPRSISDAAAPVSSSAVKAANSNIANNLKSPKDLTTAEGHEKKYILVKKKPKKKKHKKIKIKEYEPKIKYKKVKVKVPVKKYKKKKMKGYLVKKEHHHY